MNPQSARSSTPLVLCKHGTVGKCRDCLKAESARFRQALQRIACGEVDDPANHAYAALAGGES